MAAVPNPQAIKTTTRMISSSWLTVDLLFALPTNISIPLPTGCKGLVKDVLSDFCVRNRAPIHPSAWKGNSAKSTSRILHSDSAMWAENSLFPPYGLLRATRYWSSE